MTVSTVQQFDKTTLYHEIEKIGTCRRLSRLNLSTESFRELSIEVLVITSDNDTLLGISFTNHVRLMGGDQ